MPNKFPGKRCHKLTIDMTEEEHRLHRIYMRAHKNDYGKRKRFNFVGPPRPKGLGFIREKGWMGPPMPRVSKKAYRKKMKRASDNLTDYYIKRVLKTMFKTVGIRVLAKDFTLEMLETKRQQLTLWRLINVKIKIT